MGTYNLSDSITGESIPEGAEVVAFLLIDGGSESTTSYLFARTSERYKLASLPIKGKWNGTHVEAENDDSMGVHSAIFAANSQVQSFTALQEELYTSSRKEIPAKKLHPAFGEQPPKLVTFSLFVAKPGSIDLVSGNDQFVKIFSTPSSERAKIDLLVPLLLQHSPNLRSEDRAVSMEAYRYVDQLSKTIFFESSGYRFDDLEIPLTAGALSVYDDNPFSCRLGEFLESRNLYRYEAVEVLTSTNALPEGFDEAFEGIYQARVLSMGMKYMSLAFNPAEGRYRSYKDTSRFELLRHMLQSELATYIEQTTDELSTEALSQVDKVLAPLRQDVAKLVKTRNAFSVQVENFEKKYGR